MIDGAKAGLRDAVWGSALGRLQLTGRISSSMFSAGLHWAELTDSYAIASQAPRPPSTAQLERCGGTPIDPDSDAGAKQAIQHERAVVSYLEGRHALRMAGVEAERAVAAVCERDRAPVGLQELESLRTGLQALSAWWSARRKR
jgi:hypothetical protein